MNRKKVVLLFLIIFVMSALVLSINAAIREPKNRNEPVICASMWIDNVKTLEDTVACIGNYTDKGNNAKFVNEIVNNGS